MLLKIRTLLPLPMTLNFLLKKMHNHFCEAITHFMIKCSFSFLWFQCHYHYPSFPQHHSYQTKWLHYIFRWINSGMPSSFFAHVVSFTQNGLSSYSPANPGFICDVQVTQLFFHKIFIYPFSRHSCFFPEFWKQVKSTFNIHNNVI